MRMASRWHSSKKVQRAVTRIPTPQVLLNVPLADVSGNRRHESGGRSGRYGGLDFGAQDDRESDRRAVKADARRARQICAEDSDGRSNVARGGLCFQQFVDEV